MKHSKTLLLSVLVSLIMLTMPFSQPVAADQTSDTFDITVTGEFIWINITNLTWAIGVVAMSSLTFTNETGITFIADLDNCSVNTDLKLQITSDGADWTATTTGNAPAADTYRLNNSIDTWGNENETLTGVATTISEDITAGQNETFDLRFDAPTSTTTGAQQSITTTATAIKH